MTQFIPSPNGAFSPVNPWLQLAWDSTSYNAICLCPRYYFYNIIMGYTLSGEMSPDLKFGILLHSSAELYDRAMADGAAHEEAILLAFKFAIDATWDEESKRPWTSEEPTKTRNTLLRTIVWYLDKYRDENLKTHILSDGRPAVELPFRFSLNNLVLDGFKSPDDEEYLLCGYIDKVVSWNEELWISDIKTTKYELDEIYFRQYTPNNQISLYSIAGSVVLHQHIDGVIIDGIQVLVGGSKFLRKQIPRSPSMLERWLQDFYFRIREAEFYAEKQYYPMNSRSCGWGRNKCQYWSVCSSEPEAAFDILNNYYTKRVWNPLEPR